MERKPEIFCYEPETNTIRMMPSNYCVAVQHGLSWRINADLAVPQEMAVHAFRVLHTFEGKYAKDGLELLYLLTPYTYEYKEGE